MEKLSDVLQGACAWDLLLFDRIITSYIDVDKNTVLFLMTLSMNFQVFRRHGLVQITPEMGEKFDPSFQEAMFELPLPDKEPGTVAHVIRTGWTLHSRCIRSAQVGVVKD